MCEPANALLIVVRASARVRACGLVLLSAGRARLRHLHLDPVIASAANHSPTWASLPSYSALPPLLTARVLLFLPCVIY